MDLEKKLYTKSSKELTLRVETSRNPEDYKKYEEIRYSIWGDSNDNLASNRNLFSENIFTRGSSIFIGAYIDGKMVGFSYGYFGFDDLRGFSDTENIHFYSQYNGVVDGYRNDGIGYSMKIYQREIVENMGVGRILCTFDPLVSVNAHMNVSKLKSFILDYEENPYPGFAGNFNSLNIPSDRLLSLWVFDREREIPGYLDIDSVVIKVPEDYYEILESDADIALDWRLRTRELFKEYMKKRRFKIIDFIVSDTDKYYVLSKNSLC